jgi:hypothetical protein
MYLNFNADTDLIKEAIQVFNNIGDFHLAMLTDEGRFQYDNFHVDYDALVRLTGHGVDRELAVECKKRLTQGTMGAMIHQLQRFPIKGLLITEYVNPKMAEQLKKMDIQFIDTAGNAYLNEPPVFIYIKGNKPPENLQPRGIRRIFQPTGLKIIFAFLCHPNLANAPYREVAKAANVALGTVGWVMRDLKGEGYLLEMGKRGRRLTNKKKLFDRWVMAYPEKLRPKLMIGKYKTPNQGWHKDVRLNNYQGYWGGEVAAAKLKTFLKPETVTIYTAEVNTNLLLDNRLRKDPEGDIELLKIFWNTEYVGYNGGINDLVPPVLIYADLLATGEARNIETAETVYEQELAGFIRED